MRRLACCRREKEISLDLDEPDRMTTYDGLESCIINSCNYENESGTSKCFASDSLDEDGSTCSSSKDAFRSSCSSQWLVTKRDEHEGDEWEEVSKGPKHFHMKEKLDKSIQLADVETMKEKFARLLLGEDISGGRKGLSTALALTNAISTLAASVFGELWKLEPLPEERKSRWRREMDWLLSPANYMVELVPARQNTNGLALEIMTPIVRSDIHMNLPALQKLDSMLMETLDSMMNTEFWYVEGGSRAEGRSRTAKIGNRWWFPSPRVPVSGLSISARKKLLHQGKMVHQVFKAAKSINSNILHEMPVPTIIGDALPKSGKANLGERLYTVLLMELSSEEERLASLDLKNDHTILQIMNQLETAVFAWKQRKSDQDNGKSPVRSSWSFMRESVSDLDKAGLLLERAESLLQLLKIRFPNLPHTFLDVTKIQYNKDVGHSILEAYSRVLGNLAFRILSRIKDILQEDDFSNPNSPASSRCFSGTNLSGIAEFMSAGGHVHASLIDPMKMGDRLYCESSASKASETYFSDSEPKTSSVNSTPCRSRVWCINKEACRSLSPTSSP